MATSKRLVDRKNEQTQAIFSTILAKNEFCLLVSLPDIYIIKNLWGIVSNKVYEDGKEYKTADELWKSVCHHFLTISCDTIKNLYQSIPECLISVIEKGGKRTD